MNEYAMAVDRPLPSLAIRATNSRIALVSCRRRESRVELPLGASGKFRWRPKAGLDDSLLLESEIEQVTACLIIAAVSFTSRSGNLLNRFYWWTWHSARHIANGGRTEQSTFSSAQFPKLNRATAGAHG
jgi:hypothetical protein